MQISAYNYNITTVDNFQQFMTAVRYVCFSVADFVRIQYLLLDVVTWMVISQLILF